MSGLVPGGARVPGSLLQLRGEPPDPETGDSLSATEWDRGQQPSSAASASCEPVLHGQDVHQIGQGLQEALEL